MSTIVYGPQGTGKSLHAEVLREHYGCNQVVEQEDLGFSPFELVTAKIEGFKAGTILYLTHDTPVKSLKRSRRIVHIRDALKAAGVK